MPSPATNDEFLDLVRQAKVVGDNRLDAFLQREDGSELPATPRQLADQLVEEGLLTKYQASLLVKGKSDSFRIGPYRILERLGFGAMSNVYLCEHQGTKARVAVKVLIGAKAGDPVSLKRFYREGARASASLDHPNIVKVRDIDWENDTHYIVMDFIDGSSVQDIVEHFGPLDVNRAAHYIRQAAKGLQFAHQRKLVHRDIKPGNLLVDRQGTVKILDMGLARFSEEEGEALTKGGDILGAREYSAPEQSADSHNVDIRADIYSLGAILYFMLGGHAPYSEEKSVARKLLSKEQRPPKPIRLFRPEVPEKMVTVLDTMMAKDPAQRYQTPDEVANALTPWTLAPIDPPSEKEMPQLSRATLAKEAASTKETVTIGEDTPAPKKKKKPATSPAPEAPAEGQEKLWSSIQVVVIVVLGILTFLVGWGLFGNR